MDKNRVQRLEILRSEYPCMEVFEKEELWRVERDGAMESKDKVLFCKKKINCPFHVRTKPF